MTTISPSRRARMPLSRVASFIALVALLIAAAVWRAPLSSALLRVVSPIIAWRNLLDATQNAELRAELASTTAALADRNALYAENQQLKSELGRAQEKGGVLAYVLERPPGVPYDTLLIDAGQQEGIAAGDLVSAGGTTLIGEVSEAYASEARVTLFSSPGQSFQALIKGSIPVSIQGQGAGSMTGEVPAQTAVVPGDPVLFSSAAGGYTGAVSRVDSPAGESFETIYLQLPVDLFSLRSVIVETRS